MSEIEWLPEALGDIERLYTFLHDKDFDAAKRMAANLLKGTELLQSSPRTGRPMPDETGRRELFVAFGAGAYVLRYINTGKVIIIIRVWHSKENRSS